MSIPSLIPFSLDAFSWPAVLADAGLKGVVILAAAGLMTSLLLKRSAATRHLVWSIALTILLVQPVLPLFLPGWSLPLLPDAGSAPPVPAQAAAVALAPGLEAAPRALPAPPPSEPFAARLAPGAPAAAAQGRWLLWVWLAGVALLSLRFAIGVARVQRLLREASQVTGKAWTTEVLELQERLGISRQVKLLEVSREIMPMTWGLVRPVVVLPASARQWPAERRRVVLLHELAHVRRWDCLTQGLAQVACALHWPNPLAWVAIWRLLVEREQACDDQVLLCGTRPSDYATHLVDLARTFRSLPTVYPASAVLGRRSQLESRVRAVLSTSGEREATRRRLLLAGATAVVLILPLALLQPWAEASQAPLAERLEPADEAPAREPAATSEAAEPPTEEEQRGELQVMWENGQARYEVTARGSVELTPDEKGVARLARDGYLKIVAQRVQDGDLPPVTVRTLSIVEQGGRLVYEQTVEGRPRAFDAESQQWLARVLPEIVAETGFGVGTRVAHLRQSGGIERVLTEITRLKKPRVRRVFLEELLHSGLGSSDLQKVVRFAGRELPPEGDLGAFLLSSAEIYLANPEDRAAFIEVAAGISSEDEYARFMAALLESRSPNPEVQAELIRSASSRFETDETRAGFVLKVAERALAEEEVRPALLDTLKAVKAEDTLSRLTVALLDREELDGNLRLRLFETAFNGMVSDETRAGFLLQVADDFLDRPELREPYLKAARSIRKDRPRAAIQEMLRQHGAL